MYRHKKERRKDVSETMKAIDSDKNMRERCVAKRQEAIMSYKRGVRVR